jgi:hypothetical protein
VLTVVACALVIPGRCSNFCVFTGLPLSATCASDSGAARRAGKFYELYSVVAVRVLRGHALPVCERDQIIRKKMNYER